MNKKHFAKKMARKKNKIVKELGLPNLVISKVELDCRPTLVDKVASQVIKQMVSKNMFSPDREFKMTFADGTLTVTSYKKK